MTAKTLLQQCTDDLLDLMKTLGAMTAAAKRGESMPALTPEQVQTLVLAVGDALMANHRAIRAAKNKCLMAA
jgi:hypothetical protein